MNPFLLISPSSVEDWVIRHGIRKSYVLSEIWVWLTDIRQDPRHRLTLPRRLTRVDRPQILPGKTK